MIFVTSPPPPKLNISPNLLTFRKAPNRMAGPLCLADWQVGGSFYNGFDQLDARMDFADEYGCFCFQEVIFMYVYCSNFFIGLLFVVSLGR